MPKEWYSHPALLRVGSQNLHEKYYTKFFESSHVDYLQAAGARVVPIDYQLSEKQL